MGLFQVLLNNVFFAMEVQFALSHEGSLISSASAVPLEPDAIPTFVIFKFGLPSRKSSCYQQKMRDITQVQVISQKNDTII